MEVTIVCKSMEINRIQHLLNIRQNLLKEQEIVNLECYEIDIKLKRIRSAYGLQIEAFRSRLDTCDYSAVKELQSLLAEFRNTFEKLYYRQLKLRKKSEYIQDEIFEIIEELSKL